MGLLPLKMGMALSMVVTMTRTIDQPDQELNPCCVVLTTAATEAEAKEIMKAVILERLAACANFFPVQSMYDWQDELHLETEWQILFKTTFALYPLLEARILELHRYDVPELIVLPVQGGSRDYLNWIQTQVRDF